jgi:hypothetical protein
MRILRIVTFVFIGLAVALWIVTIVGWLKTDPGFEPLNVLVSAAVSSLVAAFGWLRSRNTFVEDNPPRISSRGNLEITDVGFTHNAELDVKVRNLGDNDIIIKRITILVVNAPDLVVRSALRPTARYEIPIGDLKKGESRSLDVSFCVEAHKADRFLVALNTTRVLDIRMTLHFNKDEEVSFNKTLWS